MELYVNDTAKNENINPTIAALSRWRIRIVY